MTFSTLTFHRGHWIEGPIATPGGPPRWEYGTGDPEDQDGEPVRWEWSYEQVLAEIDAELGFDWRRFGSEVAEALAVLAALVAFGITWWARFG